MRLQTKLIHGGISKDGAIGAVGVPSTKYPPTAKIGWVAPKVMNIPKWVTQPAFP
ncbi:hypothetical protein NHP22001_07570 [Helicobacter sp. NHP22-001]|nr:hypothetical protein NHP22001_07570 [Helicobacter sp. NHP22-001]